jgi:hypothetical protein
MGIIFYGHKGKYYRRNADGSTTEYTDADLFFREAAAHYAKSDADNGEVTDQEIENVLVDLEGFTETLKQQT